MTRQLFGNVQLDVRSKGSGNWMMAGQDVLEQTLVKDMKAAYAGKCSVLQSRQSKVRSCHDIASFLQAPCQDPTFAGQMVGGVLIAGIRPAAELA